MAFDVEFYYETVAEIPCNWEDAYELLADVPRSASHFPKLLRTVDLLGGGWRWEILFGVGKASLQAIYASRYISDKELRTVIWEPLEDSTANGKVSGRWTVEETPEGCKCRLTYKADFVFPLPKIMKAAVSGLIKNEFVRMTNGYVRNLERVLTKSV